MLDEMTERIPTSTLKYLRKERLPHVWCPGCGNGVIIKSLIHAADALKLDQDKVTLVGGIGCSGRTPFILDFNTMHSTHGRALAFATGVKLARPQMKVIVVMGDGDAVGIGGNHFIHACRRNIDLTAIVFNNSIYGQTGGQMAPTTPQDARSATSVYGNIEPNFDIAKLALSAGATFVARTTIFDPREMDQLITKAIEHKGFSLIEIITTCPTYFGRMNNMKDPYQMIHNLQMNTIPADEAIANIQEMESQIRDRAVSIHEAKDLTPEELKGRTVTGIFHKEQRTEYTELYQELVRRSRL
jgi:2-oxoglutarate ferredoxin oxidoreductase subunit beta